MDRDKRVEVQVAPSEAEELPEPCTDSPLAETHRPREHEPVLLSSMRRSDLLRGFEWQANNVFNPEQQQSQVRLSLAFNRLSFHGPVVSTTSASHEARAVHNIVFKR
jgi:hypothetical protein